MYSVIPHPCRHTVVCGRFSQRKKCVKDAELPEKEGESVSRCPGSKWQEGYEHISFISLITLYLDRETMFNQRMLSGCKEVSTFVKESAMQRGEHLPQLWAKLRMWFSDLSGANACPLETNQY